MITPQIEPDGPLLQGKPPMPYGDGGRIPGVFWPIGKICRMDSF